MQLEKMLLEKIGGFVVIPEDYDEKAYYNFLDLLNRRYGINVNALDNKSFILEGTNVEDFIAKKEDFQKGEIARWIKELKRCINNKEDMAKYDKYLNSLVHNKRFLIENSY